MPSLKKENDTSEAPKKESNHTPMNPPPSSTPKRHPPPFITKKQDISKITKAFIPYIDDNDDDLFTFASQQLK